MKSAIFTVITLLIIAAGYSTLTNLNAAAVASSGLECDDTMLLVSNLNETATGDSIFVSSGVRERTQRKSQSFTPKYNAWVIQGTDSCSGDTLTEWSCSSSRAGAKAVSGKMECEYGCREGHCLLPTCYDPDISKPYTTIATTTGIMLSDIRYKGVPPPTQEPQYYADYCSTNLLLVEYSCQQLGGGSYVKSQLKSCKSLGNSFRCIEGRCVSPELG